MKKKLVIVLFLSFVMLQFLNCFQLYIQAREMYDNKMGSGDKMSTINNNIYFAKSEHEVNDFKLKCDSNQDILFIVVDGQKTKSLNDFILQIGNQLNFPNNCLDNFAGFCDWLTDLSWIRNEVQVIIHIKNYDSFMSTSQENKKLVIKTLKEYILPYWEGKPGTSSVVDCSLNGSPRHFDIFLSNGLDAK